MNLYNKYFLPKILDFTMKGKTFEVQRRDVVKEASGVVLEVGFGSGLNIPYYKNITKLYALEPSEELWKLAQPRLEKAVFDIEYLNISAENIPLENNSIDYAISTWTLCSISNVQTALQEIKRVLKPQGRFLFVDHGKSPKQVICKLQKTLTPFTKHFTGGCHLDRNIENLIKEAGFKIEKIEKFSMASKPLVFTYKGVAVKDMSLEHQPLRNCKV